MGNLKGRIGGKTKFHGMSWLSIVRLLPWEKRDKLISCILTLSDCGSQHGDGRGSILQKEKVSGGSEHHARKPGG